MEPRVIGDEFQAAVMQAGRQRHTIDPAVERRGHAHAQGFPRRGHVQLFHDVDVDRAIALFPLHSRLNETQLCLTQVFEIEFDVGLVERVAACAMFLRLGLGELGVECLVRYEWKHRIGYMADSAQPASFEREFGGRDIDAHATDHDRHVLVASQRQSVVVQLIHGLILGSHLSIIYSRQAGKAMVSFSLAGAGKVSRMDSAQ